MLHIYISTIVFSLTVVMLLEVASPLHTDAPPPLRRWLRNFSLSVLAIGATLLTSMLFWSFAQALEIEPGKGLLTSLGIPNWAQWLITFLLLDGIAYGLHRLSHALPWLWRLHAVHHSDPELDATTTHRHHPAESVVSALVTLPLLLVLAPPAWAVVAYSITATIISTLAHANVALPNWLDHALRRFIVTPAFHRTHHSAHRPQTDSNYATVFTSFDLVFRTASVAVSDRGRALTIGLGSGGGHSSQALPALLAAPFRKK